MKIEIVETLRGERFLKIPLRADVSDESDAEIVEYLRDIVDALKARVECERHALELLYTEPDPLE